jgi:hypothetical protein
LAPGSWTSAPASWSSDICKANYGRPQGAAFTYRDLFEAIHPDERERARAAVERAKAGRADYDIEYRTVWPDGTVHWVLVRGQVSPDARMSGVSGVEIRQERQAVAGLDCAHSQSRIPERANLWWLQRCGLGLVWQHTDFEKDGVSSSLFLPA